MESKSQRSPFAEAGASPRSVLATPQVPAPPAPPLAEMEEPLLSARVSSYRTGEGCRPHRPERFHAAAHLAKSILGVGLLALPKVVSMLGLGAGAICMAGMALLAYASLHVLTKASVRTGTLNLSALVGTTLGAGAQAVLDLALILNCFGMLVVYLVVIGDVLVGSDGNTGLLTPECGSRRVVLAVITLLVIAPLLSFRRPRSWSGGNVVGVVVIALWAVMAVFLFVVAWKNDALAPMHWWPKGHALVGHGFKSAVEVISLLSIILVAYTCHWTLHHSMQDTRTVRERQAQGLSAGALLICTVVFLVISVSSYGVFGKGVDADIIGNYTVDALSKLVWPDLAQAGFFGIRLGVLVALTLSFPLHMGPLRSSVWQLLFRQPLQGPGTYVVTYLLLAGIWSCAALLSNIWGVLILIGSTAGAVLSLIMPGVLSLAMEETLLETAGAKARRQAGGALLLVIGLGISVGGILHVILYNKDYHL